MSHQSSGADLDLDFERDRPTPVVLPVESREFQRELTSLASVLGRKWNLVIVSQLLVNGPMGFSDLRDNIDGISSKVLSESLDDLETGAFVDRTIVSERPFRVEYSLTRRGGVLESLLAEVRDGYLRVA
jgi:DNA-binding HxlR family transcriptional regulator